MQKLALYLLIIISVLFSISAYIYSSENKEKSITIFQTADIHAHLNEDGIGILPLAETLNSEMMKSGGHSKCLLIDCGDLFQGSYEGAETKGSIIVPIFNSMKFDAFIPGNHDFDFGKNQFIENNNNLNCDIIAGNLILDDCVSQILQWKLYKKNGKKIAVIGMTNPNLKFWHWGQRYEGINVFPIGNEVKTILPNVLKESPDLIILAAHQGLYQSKRYPKGSNLINIAQKFPQIDIILGSHSHKEYPGKIIGSNTMYIQPGCYGKYISKIKVLFKNGKKKLLAELIPVKGKKEQTLSGTNKIVTFNKNKSFQPRIHIIKNPSKFIMDIMCKVSGADIVLYPPDESNGKKVINEIRDLYKLIPYEDNICKIYLTYQQLCKVAQEQYKYYKKFNLTGIDYEIQKNGQIILKKFTDKKKYSLALASYDLAGGGNRFPYLRKLMLDNSIKKEDMGILIRKAAYKSFLNERE